MPFTFAHSAAILPLARLPKKYVSITALAAGSMIPDMEYFIRFSGYSQYSHTWTGIFWFDLPLALACCYLYHGVIRDPLIKNLPATFQGRCFHCIGFDWNKKFREHTLGIILCVLAGTALHLLWDEFIHIAAPALKMLPFINRLDLASADTLIYYGFWGLNSFAGLVLLYVAFLKLPLPIKWEKTIPDTTYWPAIAGITTAVVSIKLAFSDHVNLVALADTAISGFLIGLLLMSLIKKLRTQP
jgi:hypothetical protein